MSDELNSITLEYIQWSDYNRKSSKTMDISNMSPYLFITLNFCTKLTKCLVDYIHISNWPFLWESDVSFANGNLKSLPAINLLLC